MFVLLEIVVLAMTFTMFAWAALREFNVELPVRVFAGGSARSGQSTPVGRRDSDQAEPNKTESRPGADVTGDDEDSTRRAAESGDTAAATSLGLLLESRGAQEEAQGWYAQAAAAGVAEA